ncbi:MAG: glycosyltransferase [Bacteroidales bacterium]|nr:glycosyltransferase [Bacteroidales bacterium]
MHIVIYKNAQLPALRYGGTERVIWSLGKALTRMGHRVTLLCAEGSASPFAEVKIYDPTQPFANQLPSDADLVHFHDVIPQGFDARPFVTTVHGNIGQGEPLPPMAIFVSHNHAARHGATHYVCNGLDWDDYPRPELDLPRSHFHFLGKAAWKVKNLHGAIRVVDRVPGGRLEVLGGTRLNFKMGFRLTLNPHVHFHGMVDDRAKQHYICRSRGLVFPVLWDEPFGLALTESLYYGAPVFGTPRGSLPEIVTPEVGFLSANEETLAKGIAEAIQHQTYSPRRCHEYAAERFNADVMARAYVQHYEAALNGERW